jgi:hypothetical protein
MDLLDIDIPFDCRFKCWFCGEDSHQLIESKLSKREGHCLVNIPICDECKSYRCHIEVNSLTKLSDLIKEKIVTQSAKELSIGANWTEQELQESDLNGRAFDGFKQSGWQMYLIAKGRVNFNGWNLCVDGIPIENISSDEKFEFDGLTFTSFISMLDYLSKSFSLNKGFLRKVLSVYGNDRAIDAVKFCRLVPSDSEHHRVKAFDDLVESFREKEVLALKNKKLDGLKLDININAILPVLIRNNTIPVTPIHWAMKNGVVNFETLDMLEDNFFDSFSYEGDDKAFQLFNALEIYLDKRLSSPTWRKEKDPNITLWEYVESQCHI